MHKLWLNSSDTGHHAETRRLSILIFIMFSNIITMRFHVNPLSFWPYRTPKTTFCEVCEWVGQAILSWVTDVKGCKPNRKARSGTLIPKYSVLERIRGFPGVWAPLFKESRNRTCETCPNFEYSHEKKDGTDQHTKSNIPEPSELRQALHIHFFWPFENEDEDALRHTRGVGQDALRHTLMDCLSVRLSVGLSYKFVVTSVTVGQALLEPVVLAGNPRAIPFLMPFKL